MTLHNSTNSLESVKAELEAEIPDDLTISKIRYEGPELVIHTETPRKIAEQDGLIDQLASTVRKRITVRPVSGTQTSPDDAYSRIHDLIPE